MSPGAPWFARGGWPPRPRAERPIVPDIFPDCPPGLESLRKVSTPDGVELRRRMATDPASTLEQLVSVIDACPAQVLANPAWQLATVTHPGLYGALRQGQLVAFVRCRAAEPAAIVALARKAARFNGKAPKLEWLVVEHADAPRRALEAIAEVAPDAARVAKPVAVARLRLRDPVSTLSAWREGAAENDAGHSRHHFRERLTAATDPATPARVLRTLAEHRHWVIRGAALERLGVGK